jgi:hypothetical protein
MPVPLGMQRGTRLELTLTGTNLAEPTGLWTSFPATVTIPTDNNNGKDNTRLRVVLEVPKDAPLGCHSLRLATTRGMSNFRLFCLDDLPQVLEADGNRSKATAQAVPVPCVVVGRADAEVSDYFKVNVRAGQRLTFEVLGRRLGSAFDPQLTLFDARTGRELPAGHSNDAPGLQTDPRLTYTFKEAGDYLVEIRDVMYRGGPDYWYRLRIGDFPCATATVPMAARRGSKVTVHFAGPLVDGVAPVEVAVPSDPAVASVWVAPKAVNGLHGWPVALAVSDLDEVVEQEPNNEPARANRVPVPGAVTGRFQESGDIDYYVFTAKKGQRLILEAQTHELGSPAEVYLVLKDAKGGQLAATNPAQPPRLDFTAPADGDYTLGVEHLLYWGGPAETYRITLRPYEPGFSLSLATDRLDVPPGGTAIVPLLAARRDYAGPIEVSVAGPAGITGQATLLNPAKPPPANQPAGQLFLIAAPDLPPGPLSLLFQGKATINGKTVVEYVSVRTAVNQTLANLPYPPPPLLTQIGLAVTAKPPFTLAAKLDRPEGVRGAPVPLTITATRAADFAEEIALAPVGLPPNVGAALKSIPKGQNEVKVQLNPAANAPLGQFPVAFTGKAKFQNREYSLTAAPVALVLTLPFEMKAGPTPLKVQQGGKAVLQVSAVRKGGYQGPIALEVRNLPANVTAAKGLIAEGQTTAELEVAAATTAATGDKADVNVLGTATAAANQQNASSNLVVSVQAPPFGLKVASVPLRLPQGGKGQLKVTAERKTYQGPIAVEVRNLPPHLTAAKAVIPMGQTAVDVEITAAADAAVGEKADVHVVGTAGTNQQIPSPNFTIGVLALPFDLRVEPAALEIAPGQKAKVKVIATRKNYEGPIAVELRNLPAHVSSAKATIAMGQTEAEIEVTADDEAAVGEKPDVSALGTATAGGNQTRTSPPLKVRVVKK